MNESQSAFISRQLIQDNVLIVFGLLHSMKNGHKGKMGNVALKIDISKAYDKVNWRYLVYVLRKTGFSDK